jgi:hypothetical protein
VNAAAISTLGWAATGLFVASYFFARPKLLRLLQMGGALLWVIYGWLIGAAPVVGANLMVIGAAAFTTLRAARQASGAGAAR